MRNRVVLAGICLVIGLNSVDSRSLNKPTKIFVNLHKDGKHGGQYKDGTLGVLANVLVLKNHEDHKDIIAVLGYQETNDRQDEESSNRNRNKDERYENGGDDKTGVDNKFRNEDDFKVITRHDYGDDEVVDDGLKNRRENVKYDYKYGSGDDFGNKRGVYNGLGNGRGNANDHLGDHEFKNGFGNEGKRGIYTEDHEADYDRPGFGYVNGYDKKDGYKDNSRHENGVNKKYGFERGNDWRNVNVDEYKVDGGGNVGDYGYGLDYGYDNGYGNRGVW